MKNMKLFFSQRLKCLLLFSFLGYGLSVYCDGGVKAGPWSVSYDHRSNTVEIRKGDLLLCNGLYASYKLGDQLISTREYPAGKVTSTKIHDGFGKGIAYHITYQDNHKPTLVQSFYLYPERDYLLTDFTLQQKSGVSTNYMAPVNVDRMSPVLPEDGNSRALFIPFDNDNWVRYQSHPLTFDTLTSYEVTALFDNRERHALVVGSVEHDNWKSAIIIGKGDLYNVGSLVCYGGVADKLTRDSKPHGALKGTVVKSPKMLLGYFSDWREGLEAYAGANAIVAPPREWNKAVPFGWNSWGVLQFKVNYNKAVEASDFFKTQLQNHHFVNPDHTLYIGLDSGWSNFSEKELKAFVDHCKANGQFAGVYWTPFTDWGKKPELVVKEAPQYQYKDIYLYANGKPQELDGAYAIDPTHPAVEAMMKKTSELFHRMGFKYVKLDFMTHGSLEADHWYNPAVTTGIQAYNYGMKLVDKYFGDMYINLSISPAFPAHYAQSRRIACDAWNKIKDTEYTLCATSFGWWLDRVYSFNDADHVVLHGASDGENRARITSSIITGIFITGDDFSAEGYADGKEKAVKYLTNPEVDAVATGRAFRPVEGDEQGAQRYFVRMEKDGTCYCAVFNYTDKDSSSILSLERFGLKKGKSYRIKELWGGAVIDATDTFQVKIGAKDVKLFKID